MYLVYLVLPLLFKRKALGWGRKGKKCPLSFGTLTSPEETVWSKSVLITHSCFPRFRYRIVQILCYLSFQEWSLQVMMSSEETTKPKPFTTPEGDAALFLIKCKCKITLCYLPSLGLWSNLGLWSVMHNIPINNLLGSSNLSRLRTIPALMELV